MQRNGREVFYITCPDRVIIGDPDYFGEFQGARLKELTSDENLDGDWSGLAVFETIVDDGIEIPSLKLVFGPQIHLIAYGNDVLFSGQTFEDKLLGTDSASYVIKTFSENAENVETIHIGGDGAFGVCRKIYSMRHKVKILNAVIYDLTVSEYGDTEEIIRLLFGKLESI